MAHLIFLRNTRISNPTWSDGRVVENTNLSLNGVSIYSGLSKFLRFLISTPHPHQPVQIVSRWWGVGGRPGWVRCLLDPCCSLPWSGLPCTNLCLLTYVSPGFGDHCSWTAPHHCIRLQSFVLSYYTGGITQGQPTSLDPRSRSPNFTLKECVCGEGRKWGHGYLTSLLSLSSPLHAGQKGASLILCFLLEATFICVAFILWPFTRVTTADKMHRKIIGFTIGEGPLENIFKLLYTLHLAICYHWRLQKVSVAHLVKANIKEVFYTFI